MLLKVIEIGSKMAFTGRKNAVLAWENFKRKRFNTDTKRIRNREEKN